MSNIKVWKIQITLLISSFGRLKELAAKSSHYIRSNKLNLHVNAEKGK